MSPSDPSIDFRLLFETARELYLAVHADEDYRIAAASDSYLSATMTRREEIVGRALFEVFPANPDDPATTSRQQLHEALDRARAGGPAETLPEFKYDIRRPEADGGGFEPRFWQTSVNPVRGADGRLSLILCRTEDVTARMDSAREMGHVRSRLEATLASADIGTWIWEVGPNRVTADRNLARFFGVNEEDAHGGPLEHYTANIHPDDRERVAASIADATREGRRFDMEYRICQPDGSLCWVAARGWAEKDAEGQPTLFPGVLIDITGRKRAEGAFRDSEDRLRMAVEAADLGTWDFDPKTNRLEWSDACRAMFGVAPGAPVSYEGTFLPGLHPEDRERIQAAVEEVLQPGSQGRFDVEYRTVGLDDGTVRWVASMGRVFPDEAGQAARFIGTVLDITERKRAEGALIEQSRQLQKLTGISTRINTAHDVTSVVGIITEEARHLIGAQRALTSVASGLIAPRPVTVISQDDKESATGSSYRGIVGASPELTDLAERLHGPMRVSRAEAGHAPSLQDPSAAAASLAGAEEAVPEPAATSWLAAPLVGRNTRSLGVIQLADKGGEDFSEDDEALLTQLAQIAAVAIENARLYEELREKDVRKDEFLAMLAHELRNPLAAIRNAVALGSDQDARAEEIEWSMEVINRQMRQLSRLIDDLLDVSRITQGKVQLRREPLDAARVLQSAIDTVAPLMEERQHELTVSFRPGTLHLEADPTRLEQIIVNLLANAAKYTEKGGEISLRGKLEEGRVVIRIKDNGMGIPPEKLPLMFELFTQGNRTLARSEGGLGIGLTIVRSLTELHGGTITAFSEGSGKGSEFVVSLPAMTVAKGPTTAALGHAVAMAAVRAGGGTAHRVLIVDDNADSANGMARMLAREGHDVRIVYDGHSALEAAREHQPRYVLLDIGLPGMDGYEVARRLRHEESLKETVLIAVSGYGQDSDRRRSREAGFDQHLVKPVNPEDLLKLLQHA